MTLAFKHDCERQECACLPSANTYSASLTLSVHANNLETMKQSFKAAITTAKVWVWNKLTRYSCFVPVEYIDNIE